MPRWEERGWVWLFGLFCPLLLSVCQFWWWVKRNSPQCDFLRQSGTVVKPSNCIEDDGPISELWEEFKRWQWTLDLWKIPPKQFKPAGSATATARTTSFLKYNTMLVFFMPHPRQISGNVDIACTACFSGFRFRTKIHFQPSELHVCLIKCPLYTWTHYETMGPWAQQTSKRPAPLQHRCPDSHCRCFVSLCSRFMSLCSH